MWAICAAPQPLQVAAPDQHVPLGHGEDNPHNHIHDGRILKRGNGVERKGPKRRRGKSGLYPALVGARCPAVLRRVNIVMPEGPRSCCQWNETLGGPAKGSAA
ncbi:hypothetical protein AURDEDRAFT_163802 [Auricularia subglabra TFB-10046 SS5]|nr:hypothetical protein AURDEDRAFT_163802 [Auricularia subglabra TFB-10046 SS5]